jgi:D-alanyl-D-alanine carboxypeptidase
MRRKNPYKSIVFQYVLFSCAAIFAGFAGTYFVVKVASLNQIFARIPRSFNIFERTEEVTHREIVGGRLGLLAQAYIVKRLDTGEILYEYNPDRVLPIASVTKLVTAVVAREALDLDSRVTIDENILATEGDRKSVV